MPEVSTTEAALVPSDYAVRIARDGYCILPSVVSSDVIDRLCTVLDQLPPGEAVRQKQNIYGVRNMLETVPSGCCRWTLVVVAVYASLPGCVWVRGPIWRVSNKTILWVTLAAVCVVLAVVFRRRPR